MASEFIDMWIDHYNTLDEEGRISFLLSLKREWHRGVADAGIAFEVLCLRWMREAIV